MVYSFILVEVDHSNHPESSYNSRVHAHGQMGTKGGIQSCQWVEGDMFIVVSPLPLSSW